MNHETELLSHLQLLNELGVLLKVVGQLEDDLVLLLIEWDVKLIKLHIESEKRLVNLCLSSLSQFQFQVDYFEWVIFIHALLGSMT